MVPALVQYIKSGLKTEDDNERYTAFQLAIWTIGNLAAKNDAMVEVLESGAIEALLVSILAPHSQNILLMRATAFAVSNFVHIPAVPSKQVRRRAEFLSCPSKPCELLTRMLCC